MRHTTWLAGALAAALLVSGCAAKAPAADLAAEAQAVRDRSAEWLKLAQAKDSAGIASGIFTSDATTLYDGEIYHGSAEIQASLEADNAEAPDAAISWTTSDVNVAASGDLAYECGNFTFDQDGDGEAAATTGEYVTVWTKSDGIWR
ncbi:MAG: nuclear transport factor 2 family protein, partial [Gammaproteobacteria bacterium]